MNSSQAAVPRDGRSRASVNSHRERMLLFYRRELAAARLKQFPLVPPERWRWYGVLCRQPWAWFVSLTLPYPRTPKQAQRLWRAWMKDMSLTRFLLGPGAERLDRTLFWARGDELQSRGVLHFHALVGNVLGVSHFVGMRLWERLGGGFARISPYDRSRLGALYVAKGGELELSDPFWPVKS